jgi:hypothetical protein
MRRSASDLFRDGPRRQLRPLGLVVTLGALVAGAVVILARQGGAGALSTVYAEDGTIFLQQAVNESPWAALTTAYAGYVHLGPRLAAEAVSSLPLGDAAWAIAGVAAIVISLLALLVYRVSSAFVRSRAIRVAMAASIVLVPVGQEEVFNSIANLHWFLVPVSVLVLLWNPRSRLEIGLASIVLGLTALSDPLVVVLVPLAICRVVVPLSRRAKVPAFVFLGAAAVQVAAIALTDSPREGAGATANLIKVGVWYVHDVVGRGLLGTRWLGDVESPLGWGMAIIALAIVAALAFLAFRAPSRRSLSQAMVLAGASIALWVVPVAFTSLHPPRYAVPSALLLLWALAITADTFVEPGRLHRSPVLLGALSALVVIWAVNLRIPNARCEGPTWRPALVEATDDCDVRATSAEIPITPEGWIVTLDCDDIASTDPASEADR